MNAPPARASITPQTGAVLAITLLILVVVTVLGVSGMSGSSLQMFLARNTQLKQISFQNAESAVLTGERALGTNLSACISDIASCSVDIAPQMFDVDNTKWDDITGLVPTSYGEYVVEYLGFRTVPGETDKVLRLYRITARGQGPNLKAQTRVQTVWQKCVKTDGAPCPS